MQAAVAAGRLRDLATLCNGALHLGALDRVPARVREAVDRAIDSAHTATAPDAALSLPPPAEGGGGGGGGGGGRPTRDPAARKLLAKLEQARKQWAMAAT